MTAKQLGLTIAFTSKEPFQIPGVSPHLDRVSAKLEIEDSWTDLTPEKYFELS